MLKTCPSCNHEFDARRKVDTYCSQECSTNFALARKHPQYLSGQLSSRPTLRNHYLMDNDYECCVCGISDWNGKELVLTLDHIDGNADNNFPSNLRLLCPNCDSQTSTFKGRNRGNGRAYRRK